MTRRTISCRDFITRLQQLGFAAVRQKGSHIRFEHSDGRKTTVPDHGKANLPIGLLVKIIRHDLKMTLDDFFDS